MPFDLLAPKTLKIIWLSNLSTLNVPDEWLFQKRVVRTKFDIYVFMYASPGVRKSYFQNLSPVKY